MTNPITTKTPVDAKLEAIFQTYFPDGAHHAIEPSIKNAIAQAFAAGRDFEGTKRDRRTARDEREARLTALGVQPAAFWCWTDADIERAERSRAKDAQAMGFEQITEEGGSR